MHALRAAKTSKTIYSHLTAQIALRSILAHKLQHRYLLPNVALRRYYRRRRRQNDHHDHRHWQRRLQDNLPTLVLHAARAHPVDPVGAAQEHERGDVAEPVVSPRRLIAAKVPRRGVRDAWYRPVPAHRAREPAYWEARRAGGPRRG